MHRRHPAVQISSVRLLLEPLEERTVPSDLTLTARNFSAEAGRQITATVARFTDPDPTNTQGTFTAQINWGDGQTSVGQVSSNDERFDVTGTHTYATGGTFTVSVQLVDSDGDQMTAQATASVELQENDEGEGNEGTSQGDLRVKATEDITLTPGQTFSGTVATVTDPDTSNTQGTLTATINWGDGQTSAGTVTANTDGTFTVTATHTYATSGEFKFTVQVTDTDGDSGSARGEVRVKSENNDDNEDENNEDNQEGRGDLRVRAAEEINVTPGQTFSGTVATVTDPDTSNTQGTLSATINWGDGQTSVGVVTANTDGTFTVTGTHTFTGTGEFRFSVGVTDTDGDSGSAKGTIQVGASNDNNENDDNDNNNSDPPADPPASSQFVVNGGGSLFERSGNGWQKIGASITNISTATDSTGQPLVFAVTGAHDLARFDGRRGWSMLGSFIESASASSTGNAVFVVTTGHDLFRLDASGWQKLGSFVNSLSVTSGPGGQSVVFVVTSGHDLFRLDASGWQKLGSFINSLSASSDASGNPVVFVVTQGNDLFRLGSSSGWTRLGAAIQSVTAGSNASGQADAIVFTKAGDLFRNDAMGIWSNLQPPVRMQAILSAVADQVLSLGTDGAVYDFDGSGWLSLGNPGS